MTRKCGWKLLTSFVFLLSACSHIRDERNASDRTVTQSGQCEISSNDRDALLRLDDQSFDQALPDGGWRKYQNCLELARDLIDEYTKLHGAALTDQQKRILIWHSGQLSGMLNDYPEAIRKMEQTFKSDEKPTDPFLWNPYVAASIAFLKKDKKSLLSERKILAKGSSPYNHINLRVVDSFIRCFNSSYQDAYSKTCEPKETNQDRIKSLAVDFNFKGSLPAGLQEYFQQKKIVLVGEIHGTQETPKAFGRLVSSVADEKSKTLVILEITQSSQAAIDQFLKTGDESFLRKDDFFSRDYQDGRSSKAMVSLLKRLRELPNVTVLAMDPMTGIQSMTGQERDTGMANFIHAHLARYDRAFVLCGNVHSSIAIGTPWDPSYRPMGYELLHMAPHLDSGLLNVRVRYEKVDSWNCQGPKASDCSARYGKNVPTDYSRAVKSHLYFMQEDPTVDGHRGTIFIRSTKASFPGW